MGPWLIQVDSDEELTQWLGGRPPLPYRPVLMVIQGDGPLIRELLPNALDAAKLDERRVVLWVRDPTLLAGEPVGELFAADPEVLAIVLSEDAEVVGRVYRGHLELDDAAFAFGTAAV